jgi:hypothetical protein
MTSALIGRGGNHVREVSSHQYSGLLEPKACCGRISTVPVLTTDTALTGSGAPPSALETAAAAFNIVPPEVLTLGDRVDPASVPPAPAVVSNLGSEPV